QDFGLVAMVLPLSMILQSFGANGFCDAVIQKDAIDHRQVSTLFWINLGVNTTLAFGFLAAAPLIAWFYREPRLTLIAAAFSTTILAGGLSTQHQALLKRSMQFNKTAFCEVFAVTLGTAVAIVLAWHGYAYWSLVARWVTIPIVVAAGNWTLCHWRPGRPARGTGAASMVRYAVSVYPTSLTAELRKNADKILLGRFQGSHVLGFYERAHNFSTLLAGQMMTPLTNVSLVAFSRLKSDPEEYKRNYLKVLSVLGFVCMPVSAVLALVGRDLILLLLGPQWGSAGDLFSVLALSTGVMIIYQTHAWHHLALGTTARFWRWSMVGFCVTVLLFVIGLPFGAMGVAAGYVASFYILIGPGLWYAGRPIGLKVSSVFSVLWRFFAAAFVPAGLCWLLFYNYSATSFLFAEWYRLARIITASAAFFAAYLALVVLMFGGASPVTQFIAVVRQMMPARFANKD
ncbi:MAG TPA: lipopolysaccharide biosynthesis protein, partial [Terriglobales bacterium]